MILWFLVHFHFYNTFSIHDPFAEPLKNTKTTTSQHRSHTLTPCWVHKVRQASVIVICFGSCMKFTKNKNGTGTAEEFSIKPSLTKFNLRFAPTKTETLGSQFPLHIQHIYHYSILVKEPAEWRQTWFCSHIFHQLQKTLKFLKASFAILVLADFQPFIHGGLPGQNRSPRRSRSHPHSPLKMLIHYHCC